jgi:hypothetical protein
MPETGVVGIDVCRELVEKQVGCAIGMSIGSTFCGVAGSSSVACRWDIVSLPLALSGYFFISVAFFVLTFCLSRTVDWTAAS